MTAPRPKPCPRCPDGGDIVVMTYDHGWRHVECLDCDYLGPGAGSKARAIRAHNDRVGDRGTGVL